MSRFELGQVMATPNDNRDPWESRTGILNIPTRLIRWFSSIFTTLWLILTSISSYHSVNTHAGVSWDGQAIAIVNAGAPNIGFALPVAYILTEAIDMVFGAWYRQRTRERARNEGLAEGRAEGHAEGRMEGHAEGRTEGRHEQQERWLQWLERQRQAEANGLPFDEPPPSLNGEYPTQE